MWTSEEHKKALRKEGDDVVKKLKLDRVLDIHNGADVYTDNILSTVNAGTTCQEQVKRLLDIPRSDDDDEIFSKFLEAWKKRNQKALAAQLEMATGKN